MKKLLAGLALVATLGVGAIVGIAPKHGAVEPVHADPVVESGAITVDMQNGCWAAEFECKLAVYFFDESVSPKKEEWSSLVYCSTGTQFASISYSLNFVPQKMIVVRLNNNADVARWNAYDGENYVWNQTGNLDYVANSNIMVTNNDGSCRVGTAYLKGKSEDVNWEWEKYHYLTNVHLNSKGHVEYYAELSLTSFEEFLVYLHNDPVVNFARTSFDDSVDKTEWERGENTNIKYHGLHALTATFYYDRVANDLFVSASTDRHYIPVDHSSFFTNWTDAAGSFADKYATFWNEGYSFEALDTFFRGETAEGWTGTLTSRSWKQSTQYVYFQLGGAKDYGDGEHVHLVFHCGDKTYDFYNNTFVENPMTLRYFKVPNEDFAELTASNAEFDMWVDIVDPRENDYGFANFGYLHVNQTEESTSDAMRYFLNHMSTDSREWEINKRKQIFNSYFENADQKAVFFREVSNVDDSFSSSEDFMNHWYFDHNYFNNSYGDARHFDKAIGFDSYRPDSDNSNNLPFNNDGGFFRGWYEESVGRGFVASDALRYRFVSRPFVLSGTGIISIKMAGKASLHVLDANVQNTDSQAADLKWVDNQALNQEGAWNNIALSGFNSTTMVNHVINLSQFLGRKIQLAIADVDTSGWSACYFDELVSYYSSAPAYHVDVTTQTNNSGTFYPSYPDIYVSTVDNDSSASLAAYNVWKSYIDVVRNGKVGQNYCSSLISDEVEAVLNSYVALSNEAKQIVCLSDDFERNGEGNWYNINPTIYGNNHVYNIGRSLEYLGQENGINLLAVSSNFMVHDNMLSNPATLVVIGTIIVFGSAFALFVFTRKRREN